jgi:hypothetical protein
MRHSTPDQTTNTYARTRLDQLHELAEKVGKTLNPGSERVGGVSRAVVGAETQSGNANNNSGLSSNENWWRRRAEGPEPINPAQRRKPRSEGIRTLVTYKT